MKLIIWGKSSEKAVKNFLLPRVRSLAPGLPHTWLPYNEMAGDVIPEKGQLVLCFGAPVIDRLKALGVIAKNRTASSSREKIFPSTKGGHYMVTFAPGVINTDVEKAGNILWDIRLAKRYIDTGTLQPPLGDYIWSDNLRDFLKEVAQKVSATGKKVPVSLDLETMGLFPYYPEKDIVTLQVSHEVGKATVFDFRDPWFKIPHNKAKFLREVNILLTDPNIAIRGANLKFDLVWIMQKWGIECTNFTMDTLLVGSLLNENRSNSLKWHAKEHTDIGGYDDSMKGKYDMGHMELIPKEDMLPYAGGDADATLRVSLVQSQELASEKGILRHYVKLLHPAVRAFEKIESRGIHVDREEYKRFEDKLRKHITEKTDEAFECMPMRLKVKYKDNLSLGRATLLREFMFTPAGLNLKPMVFTAKDNLPSTTAAHLEMFKDNPDAEQFIRALIARNRATKMLSTYVTGFLKHLRPDGRFHPSYMLFNGDVYGDGRKSGGTNTGRTSAKDPAVQTIPKHPKPGEVFWAKELRRVFTAPEGMIFFEADFSQGELRIAACVADDPTMLGSYAAGKDLHCVTGANLSGHSYEDFIAMGDEDQFPKGSKESVFFKRYRQQAKPANFGLLYGMGAAGFQAFAKTAYGLDLTMQEATNIRNAFFALYSRLLTWHKTYKQFAHQNGYVQSPLGRVRHLPLIHSRDGSVVSTAERQAINAPIQSCLSDLCLWSIAILEEQYAPHGLEIAGMTHDSIYGYMPEHKATVLQKAVVDVMSNLPIKDTFGWEPQLKFEADMQAGSMWADLKDVKIAA